MLPGLCSERRYLRALCDWGASLEPDTALWDRVRLTGPLKVFLCQQNTTGAMLHSAQLHPISNAEATTSARPQSSCAVQDEFCDLTRALRRVQNHLFRSICIVNDSQAIQPAAQPSRTSCSVQRHRQCQELLRERRHSHLVRRPRHLPLWIAGLAQSLELRSPRRNCEVRLIAIRCRTEYCAAKRSSRTKSVPCKTNTQTIGRGAAVTATYLFSTIKAVLEVRT